MKKHKRQRRILMLLENESFPEDTRVYLEAVALVEANFDVTVVCPTGESRRMSDEVDGVRVYRYPKPWEIDGVVGYVAEFSYSMIAALLFSIFILIRHNFDAIHVHTPPDLNVLVARCFRLLGKKIVVDHHDLSPELYLAQRGGQGSAFLHRALLWFERMAIRGADRIIATNQSQQKIQIERCGADPQRCHIVRNGPNERFLDSVEPVANLASDPRMKIGFVGIMGVQDGVDQFIEALTLLKQRRNDFLAVIVGSGPATESLMELAASRNLESHVEFTGLVPYAEVPNYIASFDVCVTPDPSNPYNDSCTTIKTMEYMALARPTVSFDTAENRITAGDAALYAQNNSVSEFSDAIERLMNDATLRKQLGQVGRERVEDKFVWDKQKNELLTLYAQLLPTPSGNVDAAFYPGDDDSHRRDSSLPSQETAKIS